MALKPDFCHEFDVGTVAGATCRYGNYWVPQCALLGTSGYYWVLIGAAMYFWVLDTKSNNCHEQKAISNNWNNCDLQIWEFMGILLIIGWILLCTDVWGTFYLVPGTFYLVRGTWLKSCDLQIWTFVCCHGFAVGMAVKQRGQKQHTGGFVIEALVNMANRAHWYWVVLVVLGVPIGYYWGTLSTRTGN